MSCADYVMWNSPYKQDSWTVYIHRRQSRAGNRPCRLYDRPSSYSVNTTFVYTDHPLGMILTL